jgi:hypothetical protein
MNKVRIFRKMIIIISNKLNNHRSHIKLHE